MEKKFLITVEYELDGEAADQEVRDCFLENITLASFVMTTDEDRYAVLLNSMVVKEVK